MENLSTTSATGFPKKGDRVQDRSGKGTVLDDEFEAIEWDDGSIEEWSGLWGTFVQQGGRIIPKEKK